MMSWYLIERACLSHPFINVSVHAPREDRPLVRVSAAFQCFGARFARGATLRSLSGAVEGHVSPSIRVRRVKISGYRLPTNVQDKFEYLQQRVRAATVAS